MSMQTLGKFFIFTHRVHCFPFHWNSEIKRLEDITNASKSLHVIYLLVLTFRASQATVALIPRIWDWTEDERGDIVVHLLNAGSSSTFTVFAWYTLLNRKQILFTINQFLGGGYKLGGAPPAWNNSFAHRLMNISLKLLVPFVHCNCMVTMAMFFVAPKSKRYFYRYLPDHLGFYILSALFEYCSFLVPFAYVVLYWIVFFMMFSYCVTNWLHIDEHDGGKLRFQEIQRKYKKLQILVVLLNESLANLIWPVFIATSILLHVLCTFVAVKYYGKLHIAIYGFFSTWSINFLFVELIVFRLQGFIYERSLQVLHLCRLLAKGRLGQRQVVALTPLGVRVGNFLVMKKFTALVILGIVSNATWNSLLLF